MESCLQALKALYLKQQPRTRSPHEMLIIYESDPRNVKVLKKEVYCVFRDVLPLVKGDFLSSERLDEIDAAVCWNNLLWNLVDSVAERVMDVGGLTRDVFQVTHPSPKSPLDGENSSSSERLFETHECDSETVGAFLRQHCAVFRRVGGLDHSELLSRGIIRAPYYSDQTRWLGRIYALGRIPRETLEQALEAVPSLGFTLKCDRQCRGHKEYNYGHGRKQRT
jgi:hypothetical protein